MKRHPALQPFSRDHNVGLVFARRLVRGDPIAEEFGRFWEDELDAHFRDEEALLGPLASDAHRGRLFAEHDEIRHLVTNLAVADLADLGRRLADHIRWEERVLFPAIEASASASELIGLANRTADVESARASSLYAPQRGALNKVRTRPSVG